MSFIDLYSYRLNSGTVDTRVSAYNATFRGLRSNRQMLGLYLPGLLIAGSSKTVRILRDVKSAYDVADTLQDAEDCSFVFRTLQSEYPVPPIREKTRVRKTGDR